MSRGKFRFFFCFPTLSSKCAMHNNGLSTKKFVLICKSTEIRPKQQSSADQYCQISISPRESRVSVCLALTRVRHYICNVTLWPQWLWSTSLLVSSVSGHPPYFLWFPPRGIVSRRIDSIRYTLSNSRRCPLTQSCLCYRSSRFPNRRSP